MVCVVVRKTSIGIRGDDTQPFVDIGMDGARRILAALPEAIEALRKVLLEVATEKLRACQQEVDALDQEEFYK